MRDKVFVAIVLPERNGSGDVEVLGAYSTKEKAEARLYRALCDKAGPSQTIIAECRVNIDIDSVEE